MRVKTFTAKSTAAAMDLVRDELGDEAVIIATRTEPAGTASITAVVDPEAPFDEDLEEPDPPVFPGEAEGTVRQALVYHGVPQWLSGRMAKATAAMNEATPLQCFAAALERHFAFAHLDEFWLASPLLLVGPSGSGKTITAAKLCARECLANRPVAVISADTKRAGGIEQLAAFARILQIDMKTAGDADSLGKAIAELDREGARIIIDMPGTNPLDEGSMAELKTLIDACDGNVVLTLAAGGDPHEAVDIAKSYTEIGAEHLMVTRMDMARRYGAVLAAAEGAGLAFTAVSVSDQIADGVIDISPDALARLMLPHMEPAKTSPQPPEAAT